MSLAAGIARNVIKLHQEAPLPPNRAITPPKEKVGAGVGWDGISKPEVVRMFPSRNQICLN